MTSYLKQHGLKLIDNGYDIIPIKRGFKYPKGLSGWQNIKATEAEVKSWLGNGFADGGVGVLAEHTPGVDIDVHDKEITQKMVAFTESLLGESLKRVGLPPKVLLPFRTDNPFSKITSNEYEDCFGLCHKVEILGDGQQFVAFAIHPDTKQPYTWKDGKSIANTPYVDLPLITQEKAQAIVDHFEKIAEREGWEKISEGQRSRDREFTGDAFENFKKPLDIPLKKIKESLNIIDPDEDRDKWIMVGMALHHQFKGDAEGLSLWDEWSSKGCKYRDGRDQTPEEKWPGFEANIKKTNPVTFASVLRLAKDRGKESSKKTKSQRSKEFEWEEPLETKTKSDAVDWTVKGFIETNTTGMLFGDPGCYKSFMAMDLALHCATGKDWHGQKVKQGFALYIAGEGHYGLGRRMRAWEKQHGIDLNNLPYRTSKRAADIHNEEDAIAVTESINKLIEANGEPPVLIVIDTLARNFGAGDENSTSDMNVFIDHVDRYLREPYGCTVLIVHHTGHKNKERARGAMALKGGVDFEYRVERTSPNIFDRQVKLSCTKMKDAEPPEDTYFEGQKVIIDMKEDEEITSLVFEKTDAPVEEEKPLKGERRAVYDTLAALTEDQERVQKDVLKSLVIEKKLIKESADFRKIIHALKKKGLVEEEDGQIRTIDPFSK